MADVTVKIPRRVFNDIYVPYLDNRSRYLIFYGGAGSGKSVFIVQRYVYMLLSYPMCNVMVVRAVGNTHRDSTFALFKQIIGRWGLMQHFRINEGDLRITCKITQNSVIFKGLDDSEKLKSVTFAKGELTDIWVEEASEPGIELSDINQLNIRLRGGKTSKQMVLSFNPIDVNHWLKKRFFDTKHDNVTILHTTYKDNRFLDEDYIRELESYKDTDPYYYDVYCLGLWGVYGKTVFDARKVNDRIAANPQPIKRGMFAYDYDGLRITNIRWEDAPDGYISIYQEPKQGYPYVLGGDTAGEGSDWFTGHVLDNTTGEQVAVLHHQMDEDLYAHQMYCLGMYYNTALIGIESNFSSYPIKELERLGYPRQYVRQREDTYTHKIVESYGVKTTSATRPVIISELVRVVREAPETINDIPTLNEMLTFVRNEKGRPEAQDGAHDDLVMGLGIAHYIRPQQSYVPDFTPERPKIKWEEDMWEDWYNADEETRQRLIQKWGEPN
jgi:phage terminase large subunit